jgi:hypothetical protein
VGHRAESGGVTAAKHRVGICFAAVEPALIQSNIPLNCRFTV